MSKASDYAKSLTGIIPLKFSDYAQVTSQGFLHIRRWTITGPQAIRFANWIIENFSEPEAEIRQPFRERYEGTWIEGGKL